MRSNFWQDTQRQIVAHLPYRAANRVWW